MQKIETLEALAQAVAALPSSVAVVAHVRPDGDALGSVAGMVGLLRALGKDAFALTDAQLPPRLKFLWDDVPQKEPTSEVVKAAALVALDCADGARMAAPQGTPVVLAIDHHVSHIPFAQQTYVPAGPSSTCQIIADLARHLKVTLPPYALQGLYAGVLTDTNRFAWGNQGEEFSKTLETAAWLVRQGVDARGLSDRLTRTVTLPYLKLQAFVLTQRSEFMQNGRVALMYAHAEELKQLGCDPADKDILISVFQAIEGVDMVFLVLRDPDGIRLSTRARSDAARLDLFCALFGGGGHKAAAGAMLKSEEPLESFLPRLREAIMRHWKAYGQAS